MEFLNTSHHMLLLSEFLWVILGQGVNSLKIQRIKEDIAKDSFGKLHELKTLIDEYCKIKPNY